MGAKRPIAKGVAMSENELKNFEMLTEFFKNKGKHIYGARVVNHLIYDECIRQGLEPLACVETKLVEEKKEPTVKKKVIKKKVIKKAKEELKLERTILKILG